MFMKDHKLLLLLALIVAFSASRVQAQTLVTDRESGLEYLDDGDEKLYIYMWEATQYLSMVQHKSMEQILMHILYLMEVYDQNGEATLPRTTTGLTENNIYIDYYKKSPCTSEVQGFFYHREVRREVRICNIRNLNHVLHKYMYFTL